MVNPGAKAVEMDHAGSTIAWREAGTGDPVIFLHGLGGSREAWGPQLRGLADRYRCIAWDMPGYGASAPIVPLTYQAIADRLVEFLDELEVATADLVGLSFGGMHALHTAIHHPDRVGRLVLADTSPAFGMDGTSVAEWTSARLAPIKAGATPADLAGSVIDAITAAPLPDSVRAETVAAFARISVDGFTAAVRCLPTNDVRDQLPDINHRALVVVGELDVETPQAYAEALAAGLPNSELHVLPAVGHLSPTEAPDAFNDLVATFLSADRPARTIR